MRLLPLRFYRRVERGERFLYRLTALVLIVLIIGQVLMVNDRIRSRLNRMESLEGIPYQGRSRPGQNNR